MPTMEQTPTAERARPRERKQPGGLAGPIAGRAAKWSLDGPDQRLARLQQPAWNFLPIHVDDDPARADDDEYVESVYREVEAAIQAGMDRLAERRSFPLFG
ncbi:MAG TPA: hypothetical protein VGJ70_03015 [Solirubrobacteraceae bacterium]